MRLREFCGSQSCFVVLRRALGSICNGHPASEVVKNQVVTNAKKSIFNATAIYEPGGREFESLRAHHTFLAWEPFVGPEVISPGLIRFENPRYL
jgi:hypothetical protein